MAGNLEVTDLTLIPDPNNADLYAAKNNLDWRVRTGEPGGVATLDGAGQIPTAQFPANVVTTDTVQTITAQKTFSQPVQTSSTIFASTTGQVILGPTTTGSVLLRPQGTGSAVGQVNLTNAFLQYNSNVGIGTDPTFAPGIGNPLLGSNNIIQYNAGNIANRILTDSAAPRTHQFTFGAAGVGVADAGLQWTTNVRSLDFITGGGVKASLTVGGAFSAVSDITALGFTTTGSVIRSSVNQLILANSAAGTIFYRPVGEGNAAGQMVQDSAGNVTATNFTATSDRNLKKDITDREVRERLPDMLRFVEYFWKDNDEHGVGLIAQELQEIAPEYVHETVEGVLSIDKAGLAVECVIGLSARLRALEEKING